MLGPLFLCLHLGLQPHPHNQLIRSRKLMPFCSSRNNSKLDRIGEGCFPG